MEHKGSGLPGLSRVVSNDRSRSSSNASTTTVFSFTKQEVNCASPRHNISIFSQVIENAPPPTIIDTKAPVELKTVRQERTFSRETIADSSFASDDGNVQIHDFNAHEDKGVDLPFHCRVFIPLQQNPNVREPLKVSLYEPITPPRLVQKILHESYALQLEQAIRLSYTVTIFAADDQGTRDHDVPGLQLGRSLHCFGVTDFVLTFPAETLISSLSDPSPVVCLDALTVGSVPVKPPSNFVFFQASETGDLDTVQRCLQRGVDVDAKGVDNWRALHFAARKGHLAVVTYLLRQGADADACTKNGWTALHLAAFQAKLSIIDVLLACEANVNPQENQGRTPLDICGDSEAKHKEAAAERLAFYGGLVSADLPKPSEEAAEIDTDATKEKETEHAQESTGNKPADPSAKQEQPEAT